MEYKYVGGHAQDLASGQMLEPGETAELDEEQVKDSHNAALIEDGLLISVEEAEEPQATEAAIAAADELGVNLNAVTGTGSHGQITKADVEEFASAQAEEGGDK